HLRSQLPPPGAGGGPDEPQRTRARRLEGGGGGDPRPLAAPTLAGGPRRSDRLPRGQRRRRGHSRPGLPGSGSRPVAVRELHPRAPGPAGRRFAFLVAALLVGLLGRTVSADEPIEQRLDALFGEHKRYLAFFQELKDAVIRDDRKKVAGLVHYPLNVFVGRRRLVVRSSP